MMDEHITIGHKYPSVKLNTTYSFGLDDQEFVVAFETRRAAGLRRPGAGAARDRSQPLHPARYADLLLRRNVAARGARQPRQVPACQSRVARLSGGTRWKRSASDSSDCIRVRRSCTSGPRPSFPDGVTHDIRRFTPFPVYVERARGSRKWDVDGNEIIDYVMGHGALLLGHLYPAVEQALERQIHRGTHLGASPSRWRSLGRAGAATRAVGGAGALHQLGHRGDADGRAARARLHRPESAHPLRIATSTAGTTRSAAR